MAADAGPAGAGSPSHITCSSSALSPSKSNPPMTHNDGPCNGSNKRKRRPAGTPGKSARFNPFLSSCGMRHIDGYRCSIGRRASLACPAINLSHVSHTGVLIVAAMVTPRTTDNLERILPRSTVTPMLPVLTTRVEGLQRGRLKFSKLTRGLETGSNQSSAQTPASADDSSKNRRVPPSNRFGRIGRVPSAAHSLGVSCIVSESTVSVHRSRPT